MLSRKVRVYRGCCASIGLALVCFVLMVMLNGDNVRTPEMTLGYDMDNATSKALSRVAMPPSEDHPALLQREILRNGTPVKHSPDLTIPYIIHQTWDDDQVPGQVGVLVEMAFIAIFALIALCLHALGTSLFKVVKWMMSWQRFNPDFQYWFWTDSSTRQLLEEHFTDQ